MNWLIAVLNFALPILQRHAPELVSLLNDLIDALLTRKAVMESASRKGCDPDCCKMLDALACQREDIVKTLKHNLDLEECCKTLPC